MAKLDTDRQLMLEQHLRKRGIRDERVLAAMATVPRELFVPADLQGEAYADRALPIGFGQTISQPYIVALVAQSLGLSSGETVLEVGCGSGYLATVLSKLANWVVGVEMVPELAREASDRLRRLGIDHVDIHVGDGRQGWPAEEPFDAIVVSAAAPAVPEALVEQLAASGRLVMPVGHDYETQQLILFRRHDAGLKSEVLCPCKFVPLVTGSGEVGGAAGAPGRR